MNIQIRLTEEMKKTSVDILPLEGNKALNALKRFGCITIEDALDSLDVLEKAKGIGRGTITQIQNAIVNYMICNLPENELIEWFKHLLDNNSADELRSVIEGFDKVNRMVSAA